MAPQKQTAKPGKGIKKAVATAGPATPAGQVLASGLLESLDPDTPDPLHPTQAQADSDDSDESDEPEALMTPTPKPTADQASRKRTRDQVSPEKSA